MAASLYTGEKNYKPTFIVLSALFLMWGLITVMSGYLTQHLMDAFGLNYNQSVIMTMAFFGAYLFISIPAAKLIEYIGFKNTIITGLAVASLGCFMFYFASSQFSYPLSLFSLFVLASGVTILQVVANPYMVLIGARGKGAQRLTFVQSFNSLGTVLATVFAGKITQIDASLDAASIKEALANAVQGPYLAMGAILLIIGVIIHFTNLPKIVTKYSEPLVKDKYPERKSVWEFHHLALGCLAIFAYVGAEVTTFKFLLAKQTGTEHGNGIENILNYVTMYWTGLMLGRFLGSLMLSKVSPRKLITICAMVSFVLVFVFMAMTGGHNVDNWNAALWVLTLTGLFNSVLFPCIFTLGMDGLGKFTEEASSLLVMSIVGGAVIPFFVFELIPQSIPLAFVIILVSYLIIAFYGFRGSRYEKKNNFY